MALGTAITVALFAAALIELLLRRVGRDLGERSDTRHFRRLAHVTNGCLAAFVLLFLGGVAADHQLIHTLGTLSAFTSVTLLVFFAQSFPRNQPAPRPLVYGLLAMNLAAVLVSLSVPRESPSGRLLMNLLMTPSFVSTVYYLQRNWRAAVPEGQRRPSNAVLFVQASVVVPWLASGVIFGTMGPLAHTEAHATSVLLRATLMTLLVVGGTGAAVLRYHLYESRELLVEIALALGLSALFAGYVGVAAMPLYRFLAERSSPALAAVVLAGVPPVAATWVNAWLEQRSPRWARRLTREAPRGVLERAVQRLSPVVEPAEVLSTIEAAVAEITDAPVRFLHGEGRPLGATAAADAALLALCDAHPRAHFARAHAPEVPVAMLGWLERLDAAMLVPVRRSGALYGVLVIARGARMTRSAVEQSVALGDHLALKLENFALYAAAAGATRDLEDYEALLEDLINSLPVGVTAIDRDFRVRWWNDKLSRETGISPREARGRHYFDELLPSLKTPETAEIVAAIAHDATQVVHRPALSLTLPDGATRVFDVTVAPFNDRLGHPTGVTVITQDVTDAVALARELEEARRLAALGAFATALAHDIRTPLTSVAMNVQMLRARNDLDAPEREHLDLAAEAIKRLERNLKALLDFARTSAPRRSSIDLRELADEALAAARSRHPGLRTALTTHGEDFTAQVDETLIRQCLDHLLDNAAAVSPAALPVTLAVDARPEALSITVDDHGPGIEPALHERVFEPFYSTRPDGSGLGLAVSLKHIKAHGGTLTLRSAPGAGASFTVSIPRDVLR